MLTKFVLNPIYAEFIELNHIIEDYALDFNAARFLIENSDSLIAIATK